MTRLCLGFDDTHVYAIKGNTMTFYDINNGTVSTITGGILNEVNFFENCMTVGDTSYAIVQDRSVRPYFQTYQFSYTTQTNQLPIKFGQPNYFIQLKDYNIFSTISFSPVKNTLSDSNNGEVCVLISSNNPSFNGLYQYCNSGPNTIPFDDSIQSKPLITVNNDMSSVFLFGYPDKNTINVYSSLKDLDMPTASYYFADGVPTSGSVQAINSNATEFILYDYNRSIYHITLPNLPVIDPIINAPQLIPNSNKKNKRQQKNQETVIAKSYALENSVKNGDVVTLMNQHVFTVSDEYNGIQFKEAPVLVPAIELPQPSQPTYQPSDISSSFGGSSNIIIICASVIGGIAILLGIILIYIFCYRKRKRRSHQSLSSHQSQQRYRMLDEEIMTDEPLPVYTRHPEHHNNSGSDDRLRIDIVNNDNNNNMIEQQDDDYNQYYDGTNRSSSRNGSIRRGIDTFIMRMTSLRRIPQSPSSSIFSFFSNGMNPPSPVEDRYQKVKNVNFATSVSNLLEPINEDDNDTLILNGRYHLSQEQARFDENLRIPGYTTRTIQHIKTKKIRTLHYYLKDQRDPFLRNINVTVALRSSKRIIRHYDALTLAHPTEQSSYQHFWLSTPCLSKQSLHYLIHHDQHTLNTEEFYFIALSTLSILLCIQDVHTADYCHLGLSLRSFFYEKPSSLTDWYVTGFDQALLIGHSDSSFGLKLDMYSAPELITSALIPSQHEMKGNNNDDHDSDHRSLLNLQCYHVQAQFEMDVWSLGCIIFEMATGKPLFNDFQHLIQLCEQSPIIHDSTTIIITPLQTHLNQAFQQVETIHPSIKGCLELLLKVDPHQRATIQSVIDYWVEANQLTDELE